MEKAVDSVPGLLITCESEGCCISCSSLPKCRKALGLPPEKSIKPVTGVAASAEILERTLGSLAYEELAGIFHHDGD